MPLRALPTARTVLLLVLLAVLAVPNLVLRFFASRSRADAEKGRRSRRVVCNKRATRRLLKQDEPPSRKVRWTSRDGKQSFKPLKDRWVKDQVTNELGVVLR